MATFTTTDLIASIKRRASVPTSQSLFASSDFLALANDEMESTLVPHLLSVKEEYFAADYDVTVASGTASYTIPTRAIGGKLRDVQLISGTSVISLPRLYEEDKVSTSESRHGFYIKGNKIIVSPTPQNSSDTLRLVHYRRPGSLVLSTACGQIQSVDTVTNQVVVASAPATFTTGVSIDFIKGSSGFEHVAIDQAITGVSGTTISFASLPSGLAVGDWVALAGDSPIPQIPVELHPVLAQAVAVKLLEAMGDSKVNVAEGKLQQMKQAAFQVISPRVDGENKKVINPNGLLAGFMRR